MITIITTDIKHPNFAFSDSILSLIPRFLSGIESYSSPCQEEKQRNPATKQGLRITSTGILQKSNRKFVSGFK